MTDPLLLTPGPLTTRTETKQAMLRDWGSRDEGFIALTSRVRARLLALAQADDAYSCVPLQGSGTFAVEAALGTLVPRDGKTLVLVNGAYGRRMANILARMGRAYVTLETPEDETPAADDVDALLAVDTEISDVALVHCETTSGILNPLAEIASVVAAHKRRLLIDAMSSFGGIPIDAAHLPFDALMASANKCLEGVPGIGFVIARRERLAASEGNAHSLSLDLAAQWRGLEANGQWLYTPPTQVLAALDAALDALDAEGGIAGRFARYWENCRTLVGGMRGLGFETMLADEAQAPIIVTFREPADAKFEFAGFYDGLSARGFLIYPGKLTDMPSFRIGCIGAVTRADMARLVEEVARVVGEMGVTDCGPAA
jgi:2-aminoethylphosphonate-pyruvate transaminase